MIEQQLADPRRLLIGGVVADARQWRETVIRLDEFGRAFRGDAADRVIGSRRMNRVGTRVGPIGARSPRGRSRSASPTQRSAWPTP